MPQLDRKKAADILSCLKSLAPDATPRWGSMTGADLVPHLVGSMELSMGRGEPVPFGGNWFSVNLIGPIATSGLVPIPKNIKLKNKEGTVQPRIAAAGDLASLGKIMEEFISGVEAGTLETGRHPAFGNIGPRRWSSLHVSHINHHLKQFGLL